MSHAGFDGTESGYGSHHDDAALGTAPAVHGHLSAAAFGADPFGAPGTGTPAYSGPPAEIGNPAEYQHYWFYQELNGYCVPASVTEVIEAQTGLTLHDTGLVEQEASQLGLPTGTQGMTLDQAQELLQHFGIPSHVEQAGSGATLAGGGTAQAAADELAGYLEQGRNIIVGVNANPIWYHTEDSAQNPDGAADHALIVTSINVAADTVTLSDTGTTGGNEETVPFDVFMDAWHASDYGMLVTDDPVGGADHAAALTAVADMEHSPGLAHDAGTIASDISSTLHHEGFILLPVALAAGWATSSKDTRRA
jgi:hypothetical protein